MGFGKEEKFRSRTWRSVKTIFFLITMLISFLIFCAPVLVAIADALLPFSLLSVSSPRPLLSLSSFPFFITDYDFGSSLIDIPLVSIARSAIIIAVYGFCDRPSLCRWSYFWITTASCASSALFVVIKGVVVFCGHGNHKGTEIFVCSLLLAMGHMVVAYRTSRKERKKLLVYKIDVEAVSAAKNGIPRSYRLLLEER